MHVFSTEEGKRVLADLEGKYFIHRPTFREEALGMAYNEGQRAVALYINHMRDPKFEEFIDKVKEGSDSVFT
jgi:hypothetical protein